jgi:hypothetical protein
VHLVRRSRAEKAFDTRDVAWSHCTSSFGEPQFRLTMHAARVRLHLSGLEAKQAFRAVARCTQSIGHARQFRARASAECAWAQGQRHPSEQRGLMNASPGYKGIVSLSTCSDRPGCTAVLRPQFTAQNSVQCPASNSEWNGSVKSRILQMLGYHRAGPDQSARLGQGHGPGPEGRLCA